MFGRTRDSTKLEAYFTESQRFDVRNFPILVGENGLGPRRVAPGGDAGAFPDESQLVTSALVRRAQASEAASTR
jgi:hypothetical protein